MEEFGNVICMLSHFNGSWSNNLSVSKLNPWKYPASPHHTCHLQPPPCAAASVVNHLPPAWICTSWRTTFAMVILGTLIKSGTFQVSVMIKSTCRHLHFKPFKFLCCGSLHHHDKTLTRSQPFHRKSQWNLIPYTIPIPWGRILHIILTTWAREIHHGRKIWAASVFANFW